MRRVIKVRECLERQFLCYNTYSLILLVNLINYIHDMNYYKYKRRKHHDTIF